METPDSKEQITVVGEGNKILKGVVFSILILEAIAFVLMFGCGAFFFFGSVIAGYIMPLFQGEGARMGLSEYESIPLTIGGISLLVSMICGWIVYKAIKLRKTDNKIFAILSVLIFVGIIAYSLSFI